MILDLDRGVQTGTGDESTVEAAVRVAASIADKALLENRAVGMTVGAHRLAQLQPDRGGRQHLKVMQLLAAVDGDGSNSLSETLIASVPRIRRGMTAVVVTPSLDRTWVKPLSTLRSRGVACVVIAFDRSAFERYARDEELRKRGLPPEPDPPEDRDGQQQLRALRHALAEFDVSVHVVAPARALGELLVS